MSSLFPKSQPNCFIFFPLWEQSKRSSFFIIPPIFFNLFQTHLSLYINIDRERDRNREINPPELEKEKNDTNKKGCFLDLNIKIKDKRRFCIYCLLPRLNFQLLTRFTSPYFIHLIYAAGFFKNISLFICNIIAGTRK